MKDKWEIVNEFRFKGIQCFIAKLEQGEQPDRSWAYHSEDGYFQFNGYCVIPADHPSWGVVDKYDYAFLEKHLKNPSEIARYTVGDLRDYDVHGGITYRSWGYGDQKKHPKSEWVIGFDTAHLGDSGGNSFERGYKKGEDYVKRECERLARQIAEERK